MEDIQSNNVSLGIIGSGGFAREVYQLALHINNSTKRKFNKIFFVEFDEYYSKNKVDNVDVLRLSECNIDETEFVIAIGNSNLRSKINNEISKKIKFTSLISPLAFIANDVVYNEGTIIMPYSYISCNVKLGVHVHINSHCTIGHDTILQDFFTSACSVMIAGNNNIERECYFGMNSSTRQGINICKNTIVGLNSGVVKNINIPGTYIGTPAKLLFKK